MHTLSNYIRLGIAFLRNNPQLIYTAILLLIIPLAFLLSSQWFLRLANENQERIERERIGMLQDVIAEFTRDRLAEPEYIQERFFALADDNPSISALRVVRITNDGRYFIEASIFPEEVGEEDIRNALGYQSTALQLDRSLIFETYAADGRHYSAFRALPGPTRTLQHALLTDVSLARIDDIAKRNIAIAYTVLAGLVLIVLAILFRQARLVDYAALYRKLKEADQMKDDFVSMAAHELRAPLTAIRGYAELLGSDTLSEKGKKDLSHIDESAQALALLIDDILDVARLQSGSMKFVMEPLDVQAAVHEVVEHMRPLAEEKHLALTMAIAGDTGRKISADPTRLRQLLTNLINNAIKYTKEGSVSVEIGQDDEHVTISVRDTGIGIDAKDQERLFGKFFRAPSVQSSRVHGTGLGLWITKAIIERMQGTIHVESIKDVGSRFVVSFPRVREPEA